MERENSAARSQAAGLNATVLCDAYLELCRCYLEAEHAGHHVCVCEGSWDGSEGDPGGITAIYSLPNLSLGQIGPAR